MGAPRGPLGSDQERPEWRRVYGLTSLTHASLLTVPFMVPSQPLRVNLDTLHGVAALQKGSYFFAEALDASGRIIPGFEWQKCMLADVNQLDALLEWHEPQTDIVRTTSALTGVTASLRFMMRDARVYSLHTLKAPEPTLNTLNLSLASTHLKAWETTEFTLRGESKDGKLAILDHLPIRLIRSDPRVLAGRLDTRDLQRGFATVTCDLATSQRIALKAAVDYHGRTIESNECLVEASPADPPPVIGDFRQYFLEAADLVSPSSGISVRANTLHYYADTRGLPATPKGMTVFNRRIENKYAVWGSSRLPAEGQIFRAETSDGITYTSTPIETTMDSENFLDMTYDETHGTYVAVERASPHLNNPFRWAIHTSTDGWHFKRLGETYHDFDGIKLLWDAARSEYVALQLSFQPLARPRLFPDNLGAVNMRYRNSIRRIFTYRTSSDLLHWVPNNNLDPRDPRPTDLTDPKYYAIVPDQIDPPDLECYWLNVFRYADRWMGIVMYVAPAPSEFLRAYPYDPAPSLHGPHVTTEWIVSSDLKTWRRPFRGTDATGGMRLYFANAPMELHDRMVFLFANQIYDFQTPAAAQIGEIRTFSATDAGAKFGQNIELFSLPTDRIAGATATAPGSYCSRGFTCPKTPLYLNAVGTGAVAVLAESGRPIPGFEADRCHFDQIDQLHCLLKWGDRTSADLAGRVVSLKFDLQHGTIYTVHTLRLERSSQRG